MSLFNRIIPVSLIAFGLTACGGGGGGGSKPQPTASSAPKVSSVAASVAASSLAVSSQAASSSANVISLHTLAEFPIGVAVSNTDAPAYNVLTNTSEQAVVEKHFDQMTAGNIMKMKYLEPTQGNFTFNDADAFVDYAERIDMKVHGHALVWHPDYQVPDFMKNWTGTPAEFLTAVTTHVSTVVNHFETKSNVISWDVVNEALADDGSANFRTNSPFYIKSGNSPIYIEKAFLAAREANANVALYYNDFSIEQNGPKMDKLVEVITDFQSRGIPLDGIGFQMHVFMDYPSIDAISAAMKKVVAKGLKVKITELDVAVNNPFSSGWPAGKISTFTETTALLQKKRYCEIVKAYLDSVPAHLRTGITVWGTTDANTWLNDIYEGPKQYNGEKIAWPLLFDANYNEKPALRGVADALQGVACS